jgi:hypothetical protein
MDIFRTLIVPADQVELARSIAASFGSGGEGMWTTPLSSDGLFPASHYISSGFIAEEFAYMVPEQFWTQDEDGNWVETGETDGNPEAVYEAAVAGGVECSQADVKGLFAVADVTEQDAFTAMSRLSLQLANEPDPVEETK